MQAARRTLLSQLKSSCSTASTSTSIATSVLGQQSSRLSTFSKPPWQSQPSPLRASTHQSWIPQCRCISSVGIKNPKTKIKTHKGTAKRWSAIASGQYKRGRPGKRHNNVTLSPNRLNKLGQTAYANPAQKKVLKRLMPGQ